MWSLSLSWFLPTTQLLAQKQIQPNIIFIFSDDHTTQAISAYNGNLNRTPNIDRIAQNGVKFSNAFCTNAVSGPSRACVLTGKLTHLNGMISNDVSFDSSQVTLPKLLKQKGYQTAVFGKWHLKSLPSGFDYYKVLPGQGEYFNPDFIVNGNKKCDSGYVTDIITNDAIQFIKQSNGAKPFFVMIQHKAPHRPWLPAINKTGYYDSVSFPEPPNLFENLTNRGSASQLQRMQINRDLLPEPDLKMDGPPINQIHQDYNRLDDSTISILKEIYKKRNSNFPLNASDTFLTRWKYNRFISDYLSCVASVDESVGQILDEVHALGIDSNTIIIYSSDQGFFLGEHGWFDKRFMYEESLRMPLLIQYPGKLPANYVSNQLVMNIDFAPSMLEWAHAPIPPSMQGKSFVPFISARKNMRNSVYYHYFEYPGEHKVKRHLGIRNHRYKLIHFYFDIDEWELYDLAIDPHEMHNQFFNPAYKAIKLELMNDLYKSIHHYGDTIEPFPKPFLKVKNKSKTFIYQYSIEPSLKYNDSSLSKLSDGVIDNYSDAYTNAYKSYVAWQGTDVNINIDSIHSDVQQLTIYCLDKKDSWIYNPDSIWVKITFENLSYKTYPLKVIEKLSRKTGGFICKYQANWKSNNNKIKNIELNVFAKKYCATGEAGEGQPAWLFMDEINLK